jgi:hypothetical protein
MTAAPGPNDLDAYGVSVYQRSNLIVSDGVKIIVKNGGRIQNGGADNAVFAPVISRIVQATQAEYDALSPPDSATLYLIVG